MGMQTRKDFAFAFLTSVSSIRTTESPEAKDRKIKHLKGEKLEIRCNEQN